MKTAMAKLVSVVLAGTFVGATAMADLRSLPAHINDAIQDRFPGAVVLEAELTNDYGFDDTEYEVDICYQGTEFDVDLTLDGVITDVDAEGPCIEF